MSLYRLCPWYSSQCPDVGANYDAFHLHSAALQQSAGAAAEFLLVGSHSGHLSVFKPPPPDRKPPSTAQPASTDDSAEFSVTDNSAPVDLILEVQLAQPILAISSGVLHATSDRQRQIVLLHPHSVAVYAVRIADGAASGNIGAQAQLELCVEHRFEQSAFSMCHGHFGRDSSATPLSPAAVEFLCVLHADGTLTFFEQNGIAYECRLASFGGSDGGGGADGASEQSVRGCGSHLPGVWRYVPRTDGFVTVNGAAELEYYRYQDAAECAERRRPLEAEWCCAVGEFVLDVAVVRTSSDSSAIVMLGECNLLCASDTGSMRFIKRLDYTPVCFHSFLSGPHTDTSSRLMTVVITQLGGFALLYAEATLVWCLQLGADTALSAAASAPVAIRRAHLHSLRGAFCTLGATGLLTVGYLGTRPHPHQAPTLQPTGADGVLGLISNVDVPRARLALAELEREIDTTLRLTEDAAVQSTLVGRELGVQLAIGGRAEAWRPAGGGAGLQCQVSVVLKPNAEHRIDQVQVLLAVASPLRCSKPIHLFRNLGGAGRVAATAVPVRASAWVQLVTSSARDAETDGHPASAYVTAVVSFINEHSVFRLVERSARLPLDMLAKLTAPVKEDTGIKLTLSLGDATSGEVPSLGTLLGAYFPSANLDASIQAIGVRATSQMGRRTSVDSAAGQQDVLTIVSAKNSSRYRLQCSRMSPLLPLVLDALVSRLQQSDGTAEQRQRSQPPPSGTPRSIGLQAVLPLADLNAVIEEHQRQRVRRAALADQLAAGVAQMRLIVRRLFVKLDDKRAPQFGGVVGTSTGGGLDGLMLLFRATHSQLDAVVREQAEAKRAAQRTADAIGCWLRLLQQAVRLVPLSAPRRDGLLAVLGAVPVRDWLHKDWAELIQPTVDLLRHSGSLKAKDHEQFVFGRSSDGNQPAQPLDLRKLQRNIRDIFEQVFRASGGDVEEAEPVENAEENTTGEENEWTDRGTAGAWQL